MESPGPIAQIFGQIAYLLAKIVPFIPEYLIFTLCALLPIFLGSHASLTRPKTADPPLKHHSATLRPWADDEDEEAEEQHRKTRQVEGMVASDVVILPATAGVTLTGLYLLIKWLDDPSIISKIINFQLCIGGIFSLANLFADGFRVIVRCVFPKVYVYHGSFYHADPVKRRAVPITSVNNNWSHVESPLPGLLTSVPLASGLTQRLWSARDLLMRKWTFTAYVHHLVDFRADFDIAIVSAILLSLCSWAWYNLVSQPWWMGNVLGLGFCYTALQLISPTTFAIGTTVLSLFFCYDIYFVFYTPIMVTVAKSLDIPAKLQFPAGKHEDGSTRYSILGLGDILLPGLMIALALRLDLFLFYRRKIRTLACPTQPASSAKDPSSSQTSDQLSRESTIKANYVSISNRWGDRFWTWLGPHISPPWSPSRRLRGKSALFRTFLSEASFPKPYFYASVLGYAVGMGATLVAMQIMKKGQPALLYLVPGVLLSLWGTALLRGEVADMWGYSDEVEVETGEKSGLFGLGNGVPKTEEKDDSEDVARNAKADRSTALQKAEKAELEQRLAAIGDVAKQLVDLTSSAHEQAAKEKPQPPKGDARHSSGTTLSTVSRDASINFMLLSITRSKLSSSSSRPPSASETSTNNKPASDSKKRSNAITNSPPGKSSASPTSTQATKTSSWWSWSRGSGGTAVGTTDRNATSADLAEAGGDDGAESSDGEDSSGPSASDDELLEPPEKRQRLVRAR